MALLDGSNSVDLLLDKENFTVYSLKGNKICLFVVPKVINKALTSYIDLNFKGDYDKLISGEVTKESVVDKISNDAGRIFANDGNAIYILPNFDIKEITKFLGENQDVNGLKNSIGVLGRMTTLTLQKVLSEKGVMLSSSLLIVERNDEDKKVALYLKKSHIGDGIEFISLPNNNVIENANPFGITEPVNNPFSQNDSIGQPSESSPINEPSRIEGVTLNNGALTGGETNEVQNGDALANEQKPKTLVRKKPNGYVNIVVLLAVLVGVTFVSIQIGKFLYDIYG